MMNTIFPTFLFAYLVTTSWAYYGTKAQTDPSCPAFFTSFGDSCYRFFGEVLPWGEAEAHCRQYFSPVGTQGHLVSIHSDAENAFIYELWRSSKIVPSSVSGSYNRFDSVWTGLNDISVEGNYQWSDNSPVRYKMWAGQEPNGSNEKDDCIHMMDIHGQGIPGAWNDIDCGHNGGLPFICKLKMTKY
ncbi:echinoidin-like [Patiria miniata]|uniref:C-type lectin domain-containing protein n=1 Tax=Patiria miniata TaxID=46514 RepID=A0A913ZAJ6_PATMI|nr:echinoidin-like [Patiria miniata]